MASTGLTVIIICCVSNRRRRERDQTGRTEGVTRRVEDLAEGVELLGNEEAGALDVVALANHGAVSTMRSTESIRHVDISELAKRGAERGDLLLVSLDLLAVDLALALLLDVEAHVLEQDNRAGSRIGAGGLNLGSNAVLEEGHGLLDELLELLGDRREGELVDLGTVWAAKVGSQHNGLGTLLKAVLDGGERADDASIVSDLRRVGLVLGNVEVDTDEHALACFQHTLCQHQTSHSTHGGRQKKGYQPRRRP